MESLSFSDTRANLKAVMDRVVADRAPIAITREKAEGVVMVSASEWSAIEETLYLLRSPRNAERLLEAVRGLEAGSGEERTLIEKCRCTPSAVPASPSRCTAISRGQGLEAL